MRNIRAPARAPGFAILLLANATAALAQSQPSMPAPGAQRPGLNQDAIDNLSRKHPGYLGALAPQNLSKARPKPAFDLTAPGSSTCAGRSTTSSSVRRIPSSSMRDSRR